MRDDADRRRLSVIDATCPLVTKVHIEVIRYAQEGYSIILIGHQNHDEVIGTFGEAPDHIHVVSSVEDVDALENVQADRVVYTTQTTLSLDDTQAIVDRLKQRFPAIISPAEFGHLLCNAESPDCRQGACRTSRSYSGCGRRKQFEFEPPG